MALPRLYFSRIARLHFVRKGFAAPTRSLCSSSPSSSSSSKPEKKEFRQSEVLSKATHHQNEVGNPWYHLRDSLIKLKEKVFSNPLSGKPLINESLDITQDATTSDAKRTGKELQGVELDNFESGLQPSERSTDSNSRMKEIATCPTSDSLIELKEKVSTNPLSEKSLWSESLDVTHETTCVVKRTGKELHGIELDESGSRLQPSERSTDSNSQVKEIATCPTLDVMSHESPDVVDSASCEKRKTDDKLGATEPHETKCRLKSSDNIQLVEQGNTLQQNNVNQGTLGYCGRDREEGSKSLANMLRGFVFEEKKATRPPDVVGSAEGASIISGELPKNKKPIAHMTSKGRCEAGVNSSTSGNAQEVSKLADQLHDNSLSVNTFSSNSMETSGDGSMKMTEIKSLLSQVKQLPKDGSQTNYDDTIISNRINFLDYVCPPKDHREAVLIKKDESSKRLDPVKENLSLAGLFMHDQLKKQVHQKSPTEVPEGSSLSEIVLQEKDKITLARLNEIVACEESNFLNTDDDTTKKVPHVVDSEIMNEFDTTKKVPHGIVDTELVNEFVSTNGSDDAARNHRKPKRTPQILNPSGREPLKKDHNQVLFTEKIREQKIDKKLRSALRDYGPTQVLSPKEPSKKEPNLLLYTEKGRGETDVLVRFVPKSKNLQEIKSSLRLCGPIDEIHVVGSSKEGIFKDAYVKFQTKEGMRNALALTDPRVADSEVVVEPASPSRYASSKLHVPNLVVDSGIPLSLVKNPTRTVMVKGLKHNITSHHLEDAFSFCGARITGFFMGSLSSVAYIEFETKIAKEKAIAACSVSVSGSKLSILRIDAPITTVVRISNAQEARKKVASMCKKYGKLITVTSRSPDVYDVRYKLEEWPSMVNILNSLNGLVVNGQQWIAQPATVLPLEILKHLWRQPDGKRQVYSLIQNLLENINDDSMPEIKDLAAQYYEERIESD